MHTRRQQKRDSEKSTTVESTTVKLVDDKGEDVEEVKVEPQKSEQTEKPEIVHIHKLSVDGEDARTVDTTGTGRGNYFVTESCISFLSFPVSFFNLSFKLLNM